jgi:UDP-N-acetylglucosamine diphosphorylase/glucosamine-1-phosphate N-acetyltransferase
MSKALVLFEDEFAEKFEPIALTRSVARIRSGLWTHRERWLRAYPERSLHLVCRGYLTTWETERRGWASVNEALRAQDVLFVAAALGAVDPRREQQLRELRTDHALVAPDGRLVAALLDTDKANRVIAWLREVLGDEPLSRASPNWPARLSREGIRTVDTTTLPETLADIVDANAERIRADFANLPSSPGPGAASTAWEAPGVHFVNPEKIRLADGVLLEPGVVLQASEGPIVIGAGTLVHANSVIRGPVAIGPGCVVRSLTRISHGVTLGPVCRVGGEVDGTIVQGHSNKQHDGFLGHSYVGEWVNLGAGSTTSDLKNDYGDVRVVIAGVTIDTRRRSLGSLIGDHSKIAILTPLNTGTTIGVSANVFGTGFPPKEIPSFTWGGGGPRWMEYRLETAIEVARRVTSRREVVLTEAAIEVLRRVHRATAHRRGLVLAEAGAVLAV